MNNPSTNHQKLEEFTINGVKYYAEGLYFGFLLNPALPSEFTRLTINQRTVKQLVEWLDFPYIESLENGLFRVSCLHSDSLYGPAVKVHHYDFMQAIKYCEYLYQSIRASYIALQNIKGVCHEPA